MMIDGVTPPAGVRPLSLFRPSAPGALRSRASMTRAGQALERSWPRWYPSGDGGATVPVPLSDPTPLRGVDRLPRGG
jgi:hypothetical protein